MWFLDALALAWTKNPKFCVGGSLTMANTVYDHKLKEYNKKIIYKKKMVKHVFLYYNGKIWIYNWVKQLKIYIFTRIICQYWSKT